MKRPAPSKVTDSKPPRLRYRRVSLRIHADEKFKRLSDPQPCGKYLWFYLIAGRHTGIIPGLSVAGEAQLAESLKWPLEGFREAFREVFREGMAEADWEAQIVWLPNAIKHNPPQSPNVILNWREAWEEIPECDLKVKAFQQLRSFIEGYGEAFLKAFLEAFGEGMPEALSESGTGTGTGTGRVGESSQVVHESLLCTPRGEGAAPPLVADGSAAAQPQGGGEQQGQRAKAKRPPRPAWTPPAYTIPAAIDTPAMRAAVDDRLEERGGVPAKERPTESQLRHQLNQLAKLAAVRGVDHAVDCLRRSTANGYRGVCFREDFDPPRNGGPRGNGGGNGSGSAGRPPAHDPFREPPPIVRGGIIRTKPLEPAPAREAT